MAGVMFRNPKPAPHSSVDERARRTRMALSMALVKLGADKPVDDITVGELAKCAGIGRSTFYAHFPDMGAFLAASYANMLASLVERATAEDPSQVIAGKYVLAHVYSARDFAGAIQNSRERPRMLAAGEARLRIVVAANLKRLAPTLAPEDRRNSAVFVVGGFMGILRHWMEGGLREPPEKVRAACEDLCQRVLAG